MILIVSAKEFSFYFITEFALIGVCIMGISSDECRTSWDDENLADT